MNTQKKAGFHYAYVIFAVCFLTVFVALGFGSSPKSTYLTAITAQLGLERSLFTINDSMRYLSTALLNFFFGSLVCRFGARRMVAFGYSFLIAACLIYSFSNTYWQFYIGGLFLGAGFAWTSTTIIGHIVEHWFTNSKGTVMGVILAANGLGGIVSENVVTRVLYGMDASLPTDQARWRLGYQLTAVLFLIVGLLVVALLRNKPSDMGLEPLGQDAVKKGKRGLQWEGFSIEQILRKPYFYLSGGCVFIMGFILQAMSNVSKPHMYDLGISKEYVIYVFSVHALVLFASKILAGVGYDRFGILPTFTACCCAAIVSLLCLSSATSQSTVTLWIYSIVSSLAMPLETIMIPLLVSELFGQKAFSRVMGYYLSVNVLGYACGVPLANLSYDLLGSYRPMLIVLTVVMTAATLAAILSMQIAKKDRLAFLAEQDRKAKEAEAR